MAASVWKGHITFGLITIPVRLLRAARSERVPLRELYRIDEPAVGCGVSTRRMTLPSLPADVTSSENRDDVNVASPQMVGG